MTVMVQVISHRGANKLAPQNTIAAFKKAIELGCDGFETDVHLSSDGHIVICHNYDIDETSDGTGRINQMTLEQLRARDFGSYFSPEFAGERLPVLEEFLEVAKVLKVINIEIKPPLDGNMAIVDKTLDMVEAFGLTDKLLVSSFSDAVLIRTKKLNSSVKTGLLYDPNSEKIEEIFEDPFGFALNIGCDALHPVYIYIDEDYIQIAHSKGLEVNPWTCNTPRVINTLLAMDVDGLITDVPDEARRLIAAATQAQ